MVLRRAEQRPLALIKSQPTSAYHEILLNYHHAKVSKKNIKQNIFKTFKTQSNTLSIEKPLDVEKLEITHRNEIGSTPKMESVKYLNLPRFAKSASLILTTIAPFIPYPLA